MTVTHFLICVRMNIAIILSGGVGNRMRADVPKQYIMVDNQPVVSYCLDTFTSNPNIDMVGVVVAEEWEDFVKEQVEKLEKLSFLHGQERQGSSPSSTVSRPHGNKGQMTLMLSLSMMRQGHL